MYTIPMYMHDDKEISCFTLNFQLDQQHYLNLHTGQQYDSSKDKQLSYIHIKC